MNKFKVGDKVRVVKYGHPLWESKKDPQPCSFPIIQESESGGCWIKDMSPELVGQIGVVDEVSLTQGRYQYGIDGIKGKHAWYNEDQLENE